MPSRPTVHALVVALSSMAQEHVTMPSIGKKADRIVCALASGRAVSFVSM
jgi:hypothetical protein